MNFDFTFIIRSFFSYCLSLIIVPFFKLKYIGIRLDSSNGVVFSRSDWQAITRYVSEHSESVIIANTLEEIHEFWDFHIGFQYYSNYTQQHLYVCSTIKTVRF